MGVKYSHSEEEEKELKKRIHEKKFSSFHTNFLDENGVPTDGSIKQIIFGSEELRKKSINDRFTRPSSNFMMSIEQIKRLVQLYPFFFDLYEETKINEFRKLLKIIDTKQQKIILKQLLKDRNLGNSIPNGDLAQLEMIDSVRQSKKLSQLAKITGKNQWSFVPNKRDDLILQNISDHLFLRREPEFLNEMILVYLVTIFKEYLKSILKEIFMLYPEFMVEVEIKMRIEKISDLDNNITEFLAESVGIEITEHGPDKIVEGFKKHLNFNLKKQDFDWKSIEETFLRRNVLVHNNGIPSKIYKKKTGYTGDSRLKTDTKYVKESLKTIEKNQHSISNFLWNLYGIPKFLDQMSSEDILE